MKMSELDYKLIDFLQIEKHVTSDVSDLRRIQHAGKYPKKVCSPAMYGANMLVSQKNIISSARAEVDRLEQENAEIREAASHLMDLFNGVVFTHNTHRDRVNFLNARDNLKQLLNK